MSSSGDSSVDNGYATYVVGGVVISLAVITTGLRFYTRQFTKMGLGADDWSIMTAMVLAIVTVAVLLWADNEHPGGLQATRTTDPNYVFSDLDVMYFKAFFSVGVLYYSVTGATKMGVMLMYYRIFSSSVGFRRRLLLVGFLTLGWWLACTIALLAACVPFDARWGHGASDPEVCINVNLLWVAGGMCEVFLDILILALPVSVVYGLHMSRARKISIGCIFLLGGFTVATGFARAYLGYSPGSHEPDYANTELWATLHTGTGLICASLPVFAPLVNKIVASSFASRISSYWSNWSTWSTWRSIGSSRPYNNDSLELYGGTSITGHSENMSSQAIVQHHKHGFVVS
ncbi:hypothetical protein S7711_07154 [Stachybotrys chartarum IBT 7711]|uniref:Rhodopsin domain-containing protein n=1 Tax=Stachybotrys chartarum (strain CBS 109288 / IBT 7711) TaxID=1280523 RepID=A0A084BAH2_STACB|nr:hypothetical protein S7711_07154 [Stachybotrys chartarum IBT 7711]KFA51614.1 hypothetical protein S40293_03970 [Stachybotrys chartarum IBT 40293]